MHGMSHNWRLVAPAEEGPREQREAKGMGGDSRKVARDKSKARNYSRRTREW